MADIKIYKLNETYLKIDCDQGIIMELRDFFTFFVDGYKFAPKFKAGIWDGTICLLHSGNRTLPVGLHKKLKSAITDLGYNYIIEESEYGNVADVDDITLEDVEIFVQSLNLHSNNEPIVVRDYQIQAIFNCIRNQRQISITSTGGGKSLIIYVLYRWYLENSNINNKPFMLVVPNLSLIRQMAKDFVDYSTGNGFDVDGNIQLISEGATKVITKSLVLVTWQSVYNESSEFFNQMNVILIDEVHLAKSASIKGILQQSTEVKYRFGVTGSLDKSKVNKLVLNGLLGTISRVKSTRDLIDEGHLSDISIKCIVLKYSKETKKLLKGVDYQKEVAFLCQHQGRNDFISKVSASLSGVTLVLYNFVKDHGVPLYDNISSKVDTKTICHFVSGSHVSADKREEIRSDVIKSTGNVIVVASFGTFSTGINIPNIDNIILAAPTKSVIRLVQCIGRGLRKSDGKSLLNVIDIADNLTGSNITLSHLTQRLDIYNDNEFEYKIIEKNIE